MNNYATFWECTKFLNWHSLEVVIQNFVCSGQNSYFLCWNFRPLWFSAASSQGGGRPWLPRRILQHTSVCFPGIPFISPQTDKCVQPVEEGEERVKETPLWFLLSFTVWLQAGHFTSLGIFFPHLNNKKTSFVCLCVGVHVHGNVIVSMRVRGQAWMSVLPFILSVAVLAGPWAPEDSSVLPSSLV